MQRLSRREQARIERLSLPAWTEEFHEEFCETMQWPRERLTLSGPASDLDVRVDPNQLRQIMWNLCENALKYAVGDDALQHVEIRYGRMSGCARPFLEVVDRGGRRRGASTWRRSSSPSSAAAAHRTGPVLARELAQTNGATLLYEPRAGGGCVFRLIFADPRRWEH